MAFLLCAAACTQRPAPDRTPTAAAALEVAPLPGPVAFNDYWYQGKAELTAYEVEQERYGAMRKAEQVNVFVTEDFSKARQVKLDNPASAGADRIPVLKLNSVRRYHTGIYDYSMMQSVFTPTDGSPTLKMTCTVQDWCGQVFTQFNLSDNQYRVREFSYFEAEGDQDIRLGAKTLLEDDLWVRLRLDPAALPTGPVQIIPNNFYARLRHKAFKVQTAVITNTQDGKEGLLKVEYQSLPRVLTIRYEAQSPYRIISWEETDEGKRLSKGIRKATRMSAYWSEHDPQHDGLRDSLRLRF
jgi:hypothetical protein